MTLKRVHASKVIGPGGHWALYVGNENRTFFRGVPVQLGQVTDTDPFGPATASFVLQQVSPLETLGVPGTDLEWLAPDTPVEIVYTLAEEYDHVMQRWGLSDKYYWRGFISSFQYQSDQGQTQVTVECQGALRVLNNILAMNEQVSRPYPYEHAIKHAVDSAIVRLGEKAGPLRGSGTDITVFQRLSWWPNSLKFDSGSWAKKYPGEWWMVPAAGTVQNGQRWSGMLTREMGKNDKTMSSYVDGMLKMMYTERGRFSMRLKHGTWQPELFHQDLKGYSPQDEGETIHIDSAWPGVGFQLEHDYSQTVTTIYGNASGTSIDGSNYTGEEFTLDGSGTWFRPFSDSEAAQETLMRREKFMQFSDGLSVEDAIQVSSEHISRNVEPGFVGSITLNSVDPKVWDVALPGGQVGGRLIPFPRQFLHAGCTVRLHGFSGRKSGVTFFVTECTHDVKGGTTTLQVDTKFRDYVTVQEVRARGRDAMAPIRLMTPGGYSPSAKDRLVPWNGAWSGYMPMTSAPLWSSTAYAHKTRLEQAAKGTGGEFPWTEATKQYPPSKHPEFYTRIAAKSFKHDHRMDTDEADQFWATHIRNGPTHYPWREFRNLPKLQNDTENKWPLTWPAPPEPEPGDEYNNWDPSQDTYKVAIGDRLDGDLERAPKTNGDDDPGAPATYWVYHPKGRQDPGKLDWFEHKVDHTPNHGDRYQCPVTGYESWCKNNNWDSHYEKQVEESTTPKWIERQSGVRLASSGTITSVRMMCVDRNGNPLPVTYHVSLWSNKNISFDAMPNIPGPYPEYFVEHPQYYPDFVDTGKRYFGSSSTEGNGVHYPFFPYAWEDRLPDGSQWGQDESGGAQSRVPSTEGLLKAFGSYWERPGTFPWRLGDSGGYTADGKPQWTGYFSWDGEIGFSTSIASEGQAPRDDQDIYEKTMGAFMIYCDDMPQTDKYFIGRIYVDTRGK